MPKVVGTFIHRTETKLRNGVGTIHGLNEIELLKSQAFLEGDGIHHCSWASSG
jgi:hypothetical protein